MSPASPRSRARLLGLVYLFYFCTAIAGGLLTRGITIPGDALATANNLLAHASRVSSASALGLVSIALYLVLTALFFRLFRPLSPSLALLATLFSLVACGVQSLADIFLAPLPGIALNPASLGPAELRTLAQASLAMHAHALSIALVLFGIFDLLIGALIFRSGFLPRILGLFMLLAGAGWLTYLWPPLAESLSHFVQPLGFLAELTLTFWLLVKGVDEQHWLALLNLPALNRPV